MLGTISLLLAAICRSSTNVCSIITSRAIPSLLGALCSEKKEVDVLKALSEMTVVKAEMCHTVDENSVTTFFQATTHKCVDIRLIAFQALDKLIPYFNDLYQEKIISILANYVSEPVDVRVRMAMLSCLKTSYITYSLILLKCVFENRANLLEPGDERLNLYLESLCAIVAKNNEAQDFLLPELVEQCLNSNLNRSSIGLARIEQLLRDHKNNRRIFYTLYNQLDFIDRTINWAAEMQNNIKVLEQAATVCTLLVRELEVSEQSLLISKWLLKILESCELAEYPPGPQIILLEGLLVGLWPEIELPDKCKSLEKMFMWTNIPLSIHKDRLTASIINKSIEGKKKR